MTQKWLWGVDAQLSQKRVKSDSKKGFRPPKTFFESLLTLFWVNWASTPQSHFWVTFGSLQLFWASGGFRWRYSCFDIDAGDLLIAGLSDGSVMFPTTGTMRVVMASFDADIGAPHWTPVVTAIAFKLSTVQRSRVRSVLGPAKTFMAPIGAFFFVPARPPFNGH